MNGVKVKRPDDATSWESWIDQQIREAQARGAFDNLPGRGRPLDLTPNPYARDQELAFKILKDAGYAPEWIELDKAIRCKIEQARVTLVRRWEWYRARRTELAARAGPWAEAEKARAETSWRAAVADFEAELESVNREIGILNLKVPGPRFQRNRLDVTTEVVRITGKEWIVINDVEK